MDAFIAEVGTGKFFKEKNPKINIHPLESEKENFLSPEIRLENVRSFKRVCHTCCDPAECLDGDILKSDGIDPLPHCPQRA